MNVDPLTPERLAEARRLLEEYQKHWNAFRSAMSYGRNPDAAEAGMFKSQMSMAELFPAVLATIDAQAERIKELEMIADLGEEYTEACKDEIARQADALAELRGDVERVQWALVRADEACANGKDLLDVLTEFHRFTDHVLGYFRLKNPSGKPENPPTVRPIVDPPKRFRHYKGGTYRMICSASHTDTRQPMIVYRSEQDGSLWARPFDDFNATLADGRKRFEPIAPDNPPPVKLDNVGNPERTTQ